MAKPKHPKFVAKFDQHAPIIGIQVRREICKRIARGEKVRDICEVDGIPDRHHVYDLIWRDPDFKRMYYDARLARAEVWAEELRENAAEAARLDNIPEKKSMAHVQAIKLQVETDKWLLGKLLPQQYGENQVPTGEKAVGDVLAIIREVATLARSEKPVRGEIVTPLLENKS